MFKWGQKKQESPEYLEVTQAIVDLAVAKNKYDWATTYNAVRAAIFDMKSAELRLDEAIRRAKERGAKNDN